MRQKNSNQKQGNQNKYQKKQSQAEVTSRDKPYFNMFNFQNTDIQKVFLPNSKEAGYFLTALFLNKKYPVFDETGDIIYRSVDEPYDLLINQLVHICGKLLYVQYLLLHGYSATQTFFSCVYFYKDFFKDDYKKPKSPKTHAFYHTLKLFYFTMILYIIITREIYQSETIFATEVIDFPLIRFKSLEKNLMIDPNKFFKFSENPVKPDFYFISKEIQESINALTQFDTKKLGNPNDDYMQCFKIIQTIGLYEGKLGQTLLFIAAGTQSVHFGLTLADTFFVDPEAAQESTEKTTTKDKSKSKNDKPINFLALIDEAYAKELFKEVNGENPIDKAPGFCPYFILDKEAPKDRFYEFDRRYLSSSVLKESYEAFNIGFQLVERFYRSITSFTTMEELFSIACQWSTKHPNDAPIFRFAFVKRLFPNWVENTLLNDSDPGNESNIFTIPHQYLVRVDAAPTLYNFVRYGEQFLQDRFPTNRNQPESSSYSRITTLLTQFFIYSFRLAIFQPSKVQKVYIRTIIPQWIRNLVQIHTHNPSNPKERIFDYDGKPTSVKRFFHSMLHNYFKQYFGYSFIINLYDIHDLRHWLTFYLFMVCHFRILYFNLDKFRPTSNKKPPQPKTTNNNQPNTTPKNETQTTQNNQPNTTPKNETQTTQNNQPNTTQNNQPNTTPKNETQTTQNNQPNTTQNNETQTTQNNQPNTTPKNETTQNNSNDKNEDENKNDEVPPLPENFVVFDYLRKNSITTQGETPIDTTDVITKNFQFEPRLDIPNEIKIFHCCFDIILYKYLHETKKTNQENDLQTCLTSFSDFLDFLKWLMKKYIFEVLKMDTAVPDYPLLLVFDVIKRYLENCYKKWYNYLDEFKEYLLNEMKYISDAVKEKSEDYKDERIDNYLYQGCFPYLNEFKDNFLQQGELSYLDDPTKFEYEILTPDYPYFKIVPKK